MTLATPEQDPIYGTDFIQEMIRQMRALDHYGTYDGQPVAKLLEPLILTRERKALIPIVGDPDEKAVAPRQGFLQRHCHADRERMRVDGRAVGTPLA